MCELVSLLDRINITIFRTKNNEKKERNKKTTTFQLGFDFIIQIVKDG